MAQRQSGAALVVALCALIVVLLLGASAAQMVLQGEKAARAERDRHSAFQAAEQALMDAENDIEGTAAAPGRSALFGPDSARGFVAGCGAGAASENLGLCLRAVEGAPPVWQAVDFSDDDSATMNSVPYGRFTGASMQTGQGFLPFRRARYIIELVPYNRYGEDAGAHMGYCYRITAIGFGSRESEVVLQSYYRKQGTHHEEGAK